MAVACWPNHYFTCTKPQGVSSTTTSLLYPVLSVNDLLTPHDLHHLSLIVPLLKVILSMSLNDVWEAAAANPFHPAVSKDWQFSLGFTLLLIGIVKGCNHESVDAEICLAFVLTGLFGLSELSSW